MPRGICKSVGGIRMPNRSSSTHSVRILSPTPVASPTPSIRGRHPPPTSPSLATLPLAEVAVSTISLSMKEPSIQLQQQQQQDDNQQQHKELPPTSKKLQGNSTNTSTTIPRKPKVDFVRFDSTEIHYTDHDEVRTKISDEIKRYATATTLGLTCRSRIIKR